MREEELPDVFADEKRTSRLSALLSGSGFSEEWRHLFAPISRRLIRAFRWAEPDAAEVSAVHFSPVNESSCDRFARFNTQPTIAALRKGSRC